MWILVVLTFGFVATDKVIMQEFNSQKSCEYAKQTISRLESEWKRVNVRPGDIRENPNFAPKMDCIPK